MKKLLAAGLVFVLSLSMLAGCQNENGKQKIEETKTGEEIPEPTDSNPQKIPVRIGALKGPTAMGMVKVMEDAEQGLAANNYEFVISGTADEISGALVKGDIDIAAIPCNLAAVLYNKTKGDIKTAAINTLGVLYILEMGETVNSIRDLKGTTIYSTGKGTTPEYTLNYLLSANGINPKEDINIEYKSEATEVAAALTFNSKSVTVAMLPQPFATTAMMQNDKLRIALDITEEWEKISGGKSSVVTGVVVVRKEFLENNKEAVDAFLTEYKKSTEYVNNDVKSASELVEKYDIVKAAVAEKAIPLCNITLIEGEEMKQKIGGYLQTLFEQNPKTVGGVLPDDNFYYTR